MAKCSHPAPAGWTPPRAPFRSLRKALTEAESRLNGDRTGEIAGLWERIGACVGDAAACAAAVNDLLAAVLDGWRLTETESADWRVTLVPAPDIEPTELAAAQALAQLVEAGGLSRLGRCLRTDCAGVFLDVTSGGNRRTCRAHHCSR